MKLLDLTLPTPAENLALDEALLEAVEAGELSDEVLRFWESPQPVVVVGRSSRVAEEVDVTACRSAGVPILRRTSGGAAIIAGPGCLMYGVVLRYTGRDHLRLIDAAHQHVLETVRSAISPSISGIEHIGISDLAIGGRKFSGNSLRCKRDHLLYHGTLLHHFDLGLISRLLKPPPRQPDYRGGRSHAEFLTNIDLSEAELRQLIASAFGASQTVHSWPRERKAALAASRYANDAWNLQR